MVGVGGAGMSGLATVMSQMGYRVSGSDRQPGTAGAKLEAVGVTVYAGHDAVNVGEADLLVASAAIPTENPELAAAREKGIPILSRAEMLGRLMEGKFGIAVAGTHGKTTTTSMLAVVLEAAGLDPTILIGGDLDLLNGNARLGKSKLLLTEACEAFNSFLELTPTIAVVTNIESDHLDYHGSLEGVMASFKQFLSRVVEGGCAVVGADCPNVRQVIPAAGCRVITYGSSKEFDCHVYELGVEKPEPSFRVVYFGQDLGEFALQTPGLHNVQNALAALSVAMELGVSSGVIREALREFRGAGRRFETLGTAAGITVVDDYAHHPTEIQATLAAARTYGRRIVAVFQPHLYSRTQQMAREFAESLREADAVILTEIYPAREAPIPGVSAEMIVEGINANGSHKAVFVREKEAVADRLMPYLKPGDMVVVMGAGDIRSAAEELLTRLSEKGLL
jgi:UDP-N-acetylmuramate--alanine ligase